MSDDHGDHIAQLYDRIAHLEGRLERMARFGTVGDDKDVDVSDASKPRARIGIGVDADGQPVKGPWVPFATVAGARNQHNPPSKGQQMLHLSPDGDFEQGVLIPLGHSEQVKSPSTDPKTYVDQIGRTVNTQADGSWTQAVGSTSHAMTDGKHLFKAGDKTEHLVADKGQRIRVEDITKLVIKLGDQTFNLKMDALQPGQDIQD